VSATRSAGANVHAWAMPPVWQSGPGQHHAGAKRAVTAGIVGRADPRRQPFSGG